MLARWLVKSVTDQVGAILSKTLTEQLEYPLACNVEPNR